MIGFLSLFVTVPACVLLHVWGFSEQMQQTAQIVAAAIRKPVLIGWTTLFYGGAAIFSNTLTDEQTVMRKNAPWASPYRASLPPPADDAGDEKGWA